MRQSLATLAAITLATVIVPSIANAATTTCSIPQACALFNNTSTGYGVEGEASSGIGVYGLTTAGTGVRGSASSGVGVSGASTRASGVTGSSSSGAGVSGTSASGTVANAGVIGTSTYHTGADSAATFGYGNYPAYGMVAYGTKYGALGRTENAGTSSPGGYGLAGMDNLGSASSDFNAALFGYSAHGTGILAEAGGTPNQGLIGIAIPIGGYFVGNSAGGSSGAAFGIEAESDYAAVTAVNTTDSPAGDQGNGDFVQLARIDDLIVGQSSGGSFELDNSGNVTISGSLITGSGGPYIRTRGASGAATIAYGDRMTAPTIEDVGEAQLSNGRSFVRIDPALADAIDRRGAYHVFLTPEGDSNGLFVTQKSSTGFVVRESRGGHSTMAFDYRIVAKPFDDNGARLAAAPAIRKPRLLPALSRRHRTVSLSPEQQARRSATFP